MKKKLWGKNIFSIKTSQESLKAALRISHLLSRCQVVFTKRGTITTSVTTATITTITIRVKFVTKICD